MCIKKIHSLIHEVCLPMAGIVSTEIAVDPSLGACFGIHAKNHLIAVNPNHGPVHLIR